MYKQQYIENVEYNDDLPLGYLEMEVGPMFSGKTTALLSKADILRQQGCNYIIISNKKDENRIKKRLNKIYLENDNDDHNNYIVNFNLQKEGATLCDSLFDLDPFIFENVDFILIDEGHLFNEDNSLEIVTFFLLNRSKNVIISCLKFSSENTIFNAIKNLYFHATINEHKSVCDNCKLYNASKTYRKIDDEIENNIIKIGDNDIYSPLCSFCFRKKKGFLFNINQ